MQGLNFTTLPLPFAAGLQQKADDRARNAPFLDLAYDVQFDEIGGVQTRHPYAAVGSSILGGGSISTARRLVANGDELLLFDKDTLYSWNAQLSKWVSKGTHLAVKVEEEPVFVTTGDQIDCDRAELSGVIVYTWVDGTSVYVAAMDKTTGSYLTGPTAITGAARPRLVALTTKILIFYVTTAAWSLKVKAIDPSDVATGIASAATTIATIGASVATAMYDVVKIAGADSAALVAQLSPTTSYKIVKVTSALALTSSTKARTNDGPIAVSCDPTGATLQVVRASGHSIVGDRITTSSLADEATGQAIGAIPADVFLGPSYVTYQIAAAHRSVTDGGQYRCYVFWHSGETDRPSVGGGFDLSWSAESNWVDTAGTIGTENDLFAPNLAVASRAFDYDGRVYVHLAFAGLSTDISPSGVLQAIPLQNTYFLLRDDGFVTAKIATGRAGGFPPTLGRLPHVALTDGTTTYSWCATERRVVALEVSGRAAYADRGPRDASFTFDSNEARRCVRLGPTLYIAGGGEILQYDGAQLAEVGFHLYPWHFEILEAAGGGGAVEDGTYAYKPSWRWQNARGDVDRSTSASVNGLTLSGGTPQYVDLLRVPPLTITHKGDSPAFELWRTAKNPTEDAPFFLVTSLDPDTVNRLGVSVANYYVSNDEDSLDLIDLAVWNDILADSSLTRLQSHPENGNVLEYLAPPPATIIAATADRIFLAGVPGDPDRVWYSRQRGAGEVASFHDALTINIPNVGGDITALAFLNETLIVFRETAVYAAPGDGFDNTGGGQNYGPARMLSSDRGAVNHESVAITPDGLIFKSSKGWMMLSRQWTTEYIGAPITDYDNETPLAVHLVEAQHQVRILTSARMLVWDYLVNQWAEWTVSDGLHACIWNAAHVYLTATGPKAQSTSYSSLTYGIDIETAWIKPADLQGACRVARALILGEYRSSDATHLRIRAAYNYDGTYVDDVYWPISPTTVGGPLQAKFGPSRQQCEAFKLRITPIVRSTLIDDDGIAHNTDTPPTGEAIKLTGLELEVGAKPGTYRRLPAAQRT